MIKIFFLVLFSITTMAFADNIPGRPDIRPIADRDIVRIAGSFGEYRSMEGHGYFHAGIDYACNVETNITATGDGEVIEARWLGTYGNAIVIRHNWVDRNGKNYSAYTIYAHLNEFIIRKGDRVKKGQVIALSGSTGRSNGPHVHYELRNEKQVAIWNGTYQAERKKEEKNN